MTTAFIAKGRLYLLSENGIAEELHSEFASKQEREADRRQSYSPWSKDNDSAGAFGGINVWAGHAATTRFAQYMFTEVARVDENTLLYTMTNGTVTGLFEYDLKEKTERRLVHRNELHFIGMDYDREQELMIVGRATEEGAAHLELVDKNGRTIKHLTDGDSVDCFPAYSHRNPNEVLFQSNGIARTPEGHVIAFGPACINRLNLETGALDEVLSDEEYDYIAPREHNDGAIYCIRRPYNSQKKVPLLKSLVDFLMAPVYFAQALYNFLKIFTQLFKNDPTMADGPLPQTPPQQQHVQVLGRTINLGKAVATKKGDEASLVPDDWELIKVIPGEPAKVLAKGVCAFDLAASGEVILTNGFRLRTPEGVAMPGKFEIVEKVRCL